MLAHKLVHKPSERVHTHRNGESGPLSGAHRLHNVKEVTDEILVLERRAPGLHHAVGGDEVVLELSERVFENPVDLKIRESLLF